MASDFARSIGKGVKSEKSLSDNWFYGFLKRWSDLKMAKPQKLQISRAKSASQEVIDTYFSKLGKVMRDNILMEAPQRIYNIDETGIITEHAPPKIICSKESNPQAITSERSANVTIIAGANAVGNYPLSMCFRAKHGQMTCLKVTQQDQLAPCQTRDGQIQEHLRHM